MPTNRWRLNIDLSDLFRDPARPALQRRDEAAHRLRSSNWPRLCSDPRELERLTQGLEDADEEDADIWWNGLYDMADRDKVFLDTHGIPHR